MNNTILIKIFKHFDQYKNLANILYFRVIVKLNLLKIEHNLVRTNPNKVTDLHHFLNLNGNHKNLHFANTVKATKLFKFFIIPKKVLKHYLYRNNTRKYVFLISVLIRFWCSFNSFEELPTNI